MNINTFRKIVDALEADRYSEIESIEIRKDVSPDICYLQGDKIIIGTYFFKLLQRSIEEEGFTKSKKLKIEELCGLPVIHPSLFLITRGEFSCGHL